MLRSIVEIFQFLYEAGLCAGGGGTGVGRGGTATSGAEGICPLPGRARTKRLCMPP